MQKIRTSMWALGFFLMIAIAAYLCSLNFNGLEWLKDLSLNVGTEVLGILLTVLLIDNVLKSNELNERNRMKHIAISQLRLPLRKHISMLLGMYKGALSSEPANPPLSLKELFGPNYIAELEFFDFSKPAQVGSINRIDWFNYLHYEIKQFQSSLSLTLEKYAVFLDSETVDLIESLSGSSYLEFLSKLQVVSAMARKEKNIIKFNFLSNIEEVSDFIKHHTDLVEEIVELLNHQLPDDYQIGINPVDWRNDIAPQFGSARI